jgi:hypothetical protein
MLRVVLGGLLLCVIVYTIVDLWRSTKRRSPVDSKLNELDSLRIEDEAVDVESNIVSLRKSIKEKRKNLNK